MAALAFGLAFANVGAFAEPDQAVRLTQAAEAPGFESVWTADHVVVPAGYRSRYPCDPSGKLLGAGIGWLEEEFSAFGVPFAGRGRRTEEAIAAMRALWSEALVDLGATRVLVPAALFGEDPVGSLARYRDDVMERW